MDAQKIVIYGAGSVAKAVILALKANENFDMKNLIGCAVTAKNTNVTEVEGVKVYSIEEIVQKYKDVFVLLAVRERYIEDILPKLESHGIKNYQKVSFKDCIKILEKKWLSNGSEYTDKLYKACKDINLCDEEYLMFLGKQLKEDKLSFEVNFADHCNLNCQCCNHFSPLAKEKFIDKTQYKKDLNQINALFGNRIGRVMLLGGEPLLNPDIVDLLHLTRKILKTATLYLITNGLKFPQMQMDFWDACKENRIGIKVTEYPLNFDYAYWFDFAKKHGVEMVNENPEPIKTTYRLPFKEKGGLDPFKNYAKCYHANQCIVLRDGRLYTCPLAAWIDYLNNHFGTKFPQKEINSIDIYTTKDAETILKYLRNPIKMCEYCDIFNYEYDIPWKTSSKDASEWIDREVCKYE